MSWKAGVKAYLRQPLPPARRAHVTDIGVDKETARSDYGLIKLNQNIGDLKFKELDNSPLGYWGSNEKSQIQTFNPKINPKSPRKQPINIAGYDTYDFHGPDKVDDIGFLQHLAQTTIDTIDTDDKTERSLIMYSHHLAEKGMSGGPIWIHDWPPTQRSPGPLQLVGISGHHGFGLLLTSNVLKDIEQFKLRLG
ncbi:MAG: hypothetical protein IPM58_02860 [Nitrospira sp.]|nr:hypothetical protein [Nitrospira sp.]